MDVVALAFYFVAVCHPEQGCSPGHPTPRWPNEAASWEQGWVESGPWFTAEDCAAERKALPYVGYEPASESPEGGAAAPQKANPWVEHGESLCYAREVRAAIAPVVR